MYPERAATVTSEQCTNTGVMSIQTVGVRALATPQLGSGGQDTQASSVAVHNVKTRILGNDIVWSYMGPVGGIIKVEWKGEGKGKGKGKQ